MARSRRRIAAAQGDANGQYNLGTAYATGFGVAEDYARAVQVALDVLLKRQAVLGVRHAQTQRVAELFRVYSEKVAAVGLGK